MSGELAGAADIVTGAVIADAVEPEAGADGHFREGNCLNCGTPLIGSFCHSCGQQGHLHRTLAAFWHDFAHGVLHFEGKIWRTLPLLAFKPGHLTRRYVHGERARFVSPLALFLFCVFLMFGTFSMLGSHLETSAFDRDGKAEVAAGVAKGQQDLRRELAAVDKKIAAAEAKGEDTGTLKRERANIAGMLRIVGGGPVAIADNSGKLLNFKTGWTRLDEGLEKANENPNLMLYKLQSNAYKYSWLLIPMSAPFLWFLFFWRRDLKMYDHVIFVTYSLSFMTLLGVVATLANAAGGGVASIGSLLLFVPPVHIYKQLKYAYGLSRAGALVRTAMMLVQATIVLIFFMLLLIALGLVG